MKRGGANIVSGGSELSSPPPRITPNGGIVVGAKNKNKLIIKITDTVQYNTFTACGNAWYKADDVVTSKKLGGGWEKFRI